MESDEDAEKSRKHEKFVCCVRKCGTLIIRERSMRVFWLRESHFQIST